MPDYQDYLTDKHALDEVLKGIDSLISIPEVYLKFRQLMENPNTPLAEYQQLVSCDPNLAARVLKLVNSALYGFSRRIGNLDDAIRIIGLNKLHDLVLAASMMQLDYPNEIMPMRAFWRCSLFSGLLARLLAKHLKIPDSESLFVIGLLHKIGCLVIYAKYPEKARQTLIRAQENRELIWVAELAILGFHYAQVGAKLMALWRFPIDFQVLTYYQPTPHDVPMLQQQTALLHLVHGYAQCYLHGEGNDITQVVMADAWLIAGCVPEQIESILEEAKEATLEIEKMMLG